jgi:hypothetical protein
MKGFSRFMLVGWALLTAANAGRCQDSECGAPLATGWPVPRIAGPDGVPGAGTDGGDLSEALLDRAWHLYLEPCPRYLSPPVAAVVTVTFQDSVDRFARQRLTRLGVRVPRIPTEGNPALDLEVSVGNRNDLLRANHAVQDSTVWAKMMLPTALYGWYLKTNAGVDTAQSTWSGLAVGAVQDFRDGAHADFNIGMTRRVSHVRPRQPVGSYTVSSTVQWQWTNRLGVGASVNYDPQMHDIDAFMSLIMQSRRARP